MFHHDFLTFQKHRKSSARPMLAPREARLLQDALEVGVGFSPLAAKIEAQVCRIRDEGLAHYCGNVSSLDDRGRSAKERVVMAHQERVLASRRCAQEPTRLDYRILEARTHQEGLRLQLPEEDRTCNGDKAVSTGNRPAWGCKP